MEDEILMVAESHFNKLVADIKALRWANEDKADKIQGLQSALKEVYALAGEDPQLSKIINTALEAYPFP